MNIACDLLRSRRDGWPDIEQYVMLTAMAMLCASKQTPQHIKDACNAHAASIKEGTK